jgi:N-acetylmuramoyl-L-alanine amidase
MASVGTNYPAEVAAQGVVVHVMNGWENASAGSSDHDAAMIHHTASSSSESPSSCANYSFSQKHYNVLVDRNGEAWIGMRGKSNHGGETAQAPLDEALQGRAGAVSAVERGLSDNSTQANPRFFSVSIQNNGVGEHYSDATVDVAAICVAVALRQLGHPSGGFCSQHRVATSRKIDACGDSCPYDFRPLIDAVLRGDTGDDDMNEADFDRIAADIQRVVTDVLRKENVSGAASYASKVDDREATKLDEIITEVLRREGVISGK